MCQDCGCSITEESHEHHEHLHDNPQLNDKKTMMNEDFMALAIHDYYKLVDAQKEANAESAAAHQEWVTGVERGTNQAFGTMENMLVDFAKTGKFSFKDMTASILEDIARIVFQLTVTIPAARAFSISLFKIPIVIFLKNV